jgi:hypothetical protein
MVVSPEHLTQVLSHSVLFYLLSTSNKGEVCGQEKKPKANTCGRYSEGPGTTFARGCFGVGIS